MIVKVRTVIVVEVEDEEQAERACATLDGALDGVIAPRFPEGDIVTAEVLGFDVANDMEIAERGWAE
jgi:hypothetical protein